MKGACPGASGLVPGRAMLIAPGALGLVTTGIVLNVVPPVVVGVVRMLVGTLGIRICCAA